MMFLLQVLVGSVILFLLVGVLWRFSSRRTSLPCPSWLAWLVEMDNPYAKNYCAQDVIRLLDLQPGMRVLDAGCGPGRITIPLAQAMDPQGEVVAIDIQPRMLQRAKDKAQAAGLTNIMFIETAIGAGRLGSNQYDRVLLSTVLGEVPNRQSALREIYCALKPAGILSVTEIVMDPHYLTRGAIVRLAGSAGFREKAFYGNRFAFTIHLEKSNNI